jgi:hypothetical protein
MYKEESQGWLEDWNLHNEEVKTFLLSLCFLSDNIKGVEKKIVKNVVLYMKNLLRNIKVCWPLHHTVDTYCVRAKWMINKYVIFLQDVFLTLNCFLEIYNVSIILGR